MFKDFQLGQFPFTAYAARHCKVSVCTDAMQEHKKGEELNNFSNHRPVTSSAVDGLIRYFIYENEERTQLKLVVLAPKDVDIKNERQWRVQVTSTRVSIDFRSSEELPEAKIPGDYQKWRLFQSNREEVPSWKSIDITLPKQISSADAHISREGNNYVLLMNIVPTGILRINTHY